MKSMMQCLEENEKKPRLHNELVHTNIQDVSRELLLRAAARIEADAERIDRLYVSLKLMCDKAERAEAELAAAREDAERYRWLVDNASVYAMHMGAVLYTPELIVPRSMSGVGSDAAIDAAIDAARADRKGTT